MVSFKISSIIMASVALLLLLSSSMNGVDAALRGAGKVNTNQGRSLSETGSWCPSAYPGVGATTQCSALASPLTGECVYNSNGALLWSKVVSNMDNNKGKGKFAPTFVATSNDHVCSCQGGQLVC